jgi:hypothetical protein
MANNTGKKYGGRVVGTPNKLTTELRSLLKNVVHREIELLTEHLSKLDVSERLDLLIKLLPFAVPKVELINYQDDEPTFWDNISPLE